MHIPTKVISIGTRQVQVQGSLVRISREKQRTSSHLQRLLLHRLRLGRHEEEDREDIMRLTAADTPRRCSPYP